MSVFSDLSDVKTDVLHLDIWQVHFTVYTMAYRYGYIIYYPAYIM